MSKIDHSPQAGLIIKAFAIIHLLSCKRTMQLKDIALQTNISIPMVHKCMQTLCDLGYAYQDEQSLRYGLTFKLASLSSNMLTHYNITELSISNLQDLGDKVKETVHLAVRDDNMCVYLHKIDSHYPLRLYSHVGKTAPLYCTGIGKVVLAYEDKKTIESVTSSIEYIRHTENTINSKKALIKQLSVIISQGFAQDIEEHSHYIRCLAYPIFNFENKIAAGISISMPTVRWSEEINNYHHEVLQKASRDISYILGGKSEI